MEWLGAVDGVVGLDLPAAPSRAATIGVTPSRVPFLRSFDLRIEVSADGATPTGTVRVSVSGRPPVTVALVDGAQARSGLALPAETPPYGFDVLINEMPRGRERRRGQLVLSGGAGEFVYLRGDRHDVERLVTLRISDD